MTNLVQKKSTRGTKSQIASNQPILSKQNHILRRIFGKTDPQKPANDNINRRNIRSYGQTVRNHAGSPYQGAATKMWWLP